MQKLIRKLLFIYFFGLAEKFKRRKSAKQIDKNRKEQLNLYFVLRGWGNLTTP